jgi:D-tyrosyl-tRNA(Tyr) deacylase
VLLQRAARACVSVADVTEGSCDGPCLVAFVGVTHTDERATARALASKAWHLRIFDSPLPEGPREVSAASLSLPVLVISQFTLYGDTRKGRRPTWEAAAPAQLAAPLVEEFCAALRELGAHVETGVFGADMQVSLTNDGPFTLLLEA